MFRIDRMHDAHLGVIEFDPPPDTEIPDWFDLTQHELRVTLRMRPEQVDALPRASRIAESGASSTTDWWRWTSSSPANAGSTISW